MVSKGMETLWGAPIAVHKQSNMIISDMIFERNCYQHFNTKSKPNINTKQESKISSPAICAEKGIFNSDVDEKTIYHNEISSFVRKISDITDISERIERNKLDKNRRLNNLDGGDGSTLILAVDATPTRGGGLLRLSGQERTVFYYSIDWTTHFEFPPEPPKFEMVNAGIALEVFDQFLRAYRHRYDNFVLKTDSNFYDSIRGLKDPYNFEFMQRVREKMNGFKGNFQRALLSDNDIDIINADYLSRTEIPVGMKVEYLKDTDSTYNCKCGLFTYDYILIDVSKTVRQQTLDIMRSKVPGRYLKGYTSSLVDFI